MLPEDQSGTGGQEGLGGGKRKSGGWRGRNTLRHTFPPRQVTTAICLGCSSEVRLQDEEGAETKIELGWQQLGEDKHGGFFREPGAQAGRWRAKRDRKDPLCSDPLQVKVRHLRRESEEQDWGELLKNREKKNRYRQQTGMSLKTRNE